MPSQFGGIAVDNTQQQPIAASGSQFGGIPLDAQATANKGFIDRVSDDYYKRKGLAADAATAYNEGKQSYPETVGQTIGKGIIGFGNDVVGNALGSAGRYVDDATPDFIAQPVKQGAKDVFHYVADSDVGDVARYAISGYKDFAQNNPRAARNVEALGNAVGLATAFTPVKGISAAGTALDAAQAAGTGIAKVVGVAGAPLNVITKGAKNLLEGVKADSPELMQETAQDLFSGAGSKYNQMREVGATLTPGSGANLVNSINDAISSKSFIPQLNPKTQAIAEHINQAYADGNISVSDLDQYRRLLGKIGNTEDGVAAGAVRKAIDEHVNALTPDDLADGSIKSVELLNQGRTQYQQASKYQAIADVLQKADGDQSKIKSGLTRFLNNDNNVKGFTDEEMSALRNAADRTLGEKSLRSLGTFGFDTGNIKNIALPTLVKTGALAVPGGTPLVAAGTAARQAGKYIARGKAQKLLDIIANGGQIAAKDIGELSPQEAPQILSLLQQTKGMNPDQLRAFIENGGKPQRLLAGPTDKTLAVDATGIVRPQTESEREIADSIRQNYNDLGYTPDVRATVKRNADEQLWNGISEQQRNTISNQIEEMWRSHQMSPQDIGAEANRQVVRLKRLYQNHSGIK